MFQVSEGTSRDSWGGALFVPRCFLPLRLLVGFPGLVNPLLSRLCRSAVTEMSLGFNHCAVGEMTLIESEATFTARAGAFVPHAQPIAGLSCLLLPRITTGCHWLPFRLKSALIAKGLLHLLSNIVNADDHYGRSDGEQELQGASSLEGIFSLCSLASLRSLAKDRDTPQWVL